MVVDDGDSIRQIMNSVYEKLHTFLTTTSPTTPTTTTNTTSTSTTTAADMMSTLTPKASLQNDAPVTPGDPPPLLTKQTALEGFLLHRAATSRRVQSVKTQKNDTKVHLRRRKGILLCRCAAKRKKKKRWQESTYKHTNLLFTPTQASDVNIS